MPSSRSYYASPPNSPCSSSWKTCTGSIPLYWSCSVSSSTKAPPPASWRSSPIGLTSARHGWAFAPHPGDAQSLAAAPGHGADYPGSTPQGPAPRGGRTGGGQDRWGAAVCRGVDEDGPRVRPPPGGRGGLCADRAPAPAGDSHHAARLPHGTLGSLGDGEGLGATRGNPWA